MTQAIHCLYSQFSVGDSSFQKASDFLARRYASLVRRAPLPWKQAELILEDMLSQADVGEKDADHFAELLKMKLPEIDSPNVVVVGPGQRINDVLAVFKRWPDANLHIVDLPYNEGVVNWKKTFPEKQVNTLYTANFLADVRRLNLLFDVVIVRHPDATSLNPVVPGGSSRKETWESIFESVPAFLHPTGSMIVTTYKKVERDVVLQSLQKIGEVVLSRFKKGIKVPLADVLMLTSLEGDTSKALCVNSDVKRDNFILVLKSLPKK